MHHKVVTVEDLGRRRCQVHEKESIQTANAITCDTAACVCVKSDQTLNTTHDHGEHYADAEACPEANDSL